jgi:magnesium chelatase subunit D
MIDPATTHILAAAAIAPELRSILAIDRDPSEIESLSQLFVAMLEAAGSGPVHVFRLGATGSEERLWSRVRIAGTGISLEFEQLPGGLARIEGTTIAVIPQLHRLGLPEARAVVALGSAPVGHIERNRMSRTFRPSIAWLAGCPQEAIGEVSPHILDRLTVRLPPDPNATRRRTGLQLLADVGASSTIQSELDPALAQRITAAAARQANIKGRALARVLQVCDRAQTSTPRRELTLARLAVAFARLDGDPDVGVRHVIAASSALGYDISTRRPTPARIPEAAALPPDAEPSSTYDAAVTDEGHPARREVVTDAGSDDGTIEEPSESELLEPVMVSATTAYPEDDAEPRREHEPLRFQGSRTVDRRRGHGLIIGVEPAAHLEDLAFVETVIESAKFQAIRSRRETSVGRLLISPTDLRSYRRLPAPEHMLTLVLDHTCRHGWDWMAALLPYLRWAYTHRAMICVVEVGAPGDDLKASSFVARSLLDDRVGRALDREPGDSTPLAHGLDLALGTLRHGLEHGVAGVRRAWLVVVTDGRGNVPLGVSRGRPLAGPVGRGGIDDALEVATQIRGLNRITSVVIDAGVEPHADLPYLLADALGATAVARQTTNDRPDVEGRYSDAVAPG